MKSETMGNKLHTQRHSIDYAKERDYLEEAKAQRKELKAQRERTLKKLQATMAPKEMTEEEL